MCGPALRPWRRRRRQQNVPRVVVRCVPLAELVQAGGTDELRQVVVYMAATISVDTTLGNRSAGTDSRMRYGDTYREVES